MKQQCFLCHPNEQLVYAKSDHFFAMLGLGPLMEGYSLLATKAHLSSMIDLPTALNDELMNFKRQVKRKLTSHYGPVVVTEHGRVPPCVRVDSVGTENHCLHAHNLIFPASLDITESLKKRGLRLAEFTSFNEARENFTWSGEYYYFERVDDSCVIAFEPRRMIRQFFRYLIAEQIGRPELADWKKYPQLELVLKAKNELLPETR